MSKTQRNRIEELEKALKMAYYQLKHIGCFQGCHQGVLQIAEDEFEQCQCCGEQDIIKRTLGIEEEKTIKTEDNGLPF